MKSLMTLIVLAGLVGATTARAEAPPRLAVNPPSEATTLTNEPPAAPPSPAAIAPAAPKAPAKRWNDALWRPAADAPIVVLQWL